MRNAKSANVSFGGVRFWDLSRWGSIWLVALGAAIWGTDSILRQPLLKTFSSTEIVLLEHLFLALYALPVAWLNRKQLRGLSLPQWGAILFISWGGSAIATILFTQAFAYGNANVVLLLQKVQPIFAILLAGWVLKEKLPKSFGLYLLLALAGTYLLTFGFGKPTSLAGSSNELAAALLALGAAALWGGSTVMGRLLLNKLSFETVTAMRFLFALPLMVLLVQFSGTNWSHLFAQAALPTPFLMVLLQALLPGLISLLLYYRGLSGTKASYATLAELAFPAAGVTLNWVFLHQGFTLGQWAGFALIWLIVYRIAKLQDNRTK